MNIDRTATVAAGAGATIKSGDGQLRRVLVTAAGTGIGVVPFYDNTSASGTVIGAIPANAAAGSFYVFDMPAAVGITVGAVASGPAMTVSFV